MRDDGQSDFFGALWAPVARALSPPAGDRDAVAADELQLASGRLLVRYVRHPRARRYRLLFRRDGTARCTVPRRGTLIEARRFVKSNESWLAERVRRHLANPPATTALRPGGTVWLHGVETVLELTSGEGVSPARARLGEVEFMLKSVEGDLRPAVELALRRFATGFLVARAKELAAVHDFMDRFKQVSVRNQRTRWGSCSARGLICLNWRLIQAPPSVRDYVILHELAHLRQLNHSERFWAEVQRICPDYAAAELWLKRSGRLVL